MLAHRHMGLIMLLTGEPSPALEHFLQGFTRDDVQQHRTLALAYGQDPACVALIWSGTGQWLLGYPDQASSTFQDVLNLSQKVAHPFTIAVVQIITISHHIRSRSFDAALHQAEALLDLASTQGFAYFVVLATIAQGACRVQLGRTEEGIASLTQGLATTARMGALIYRSEHLAWFANACLIAREVDEGLQTLVEAFSHVDKTGERYWEAELHRIKGELLLLRAGNDQAGNEQEAEGCYHQSLDFAKRQGAMSWQLRTAMSLARGRRKARRRRRKSYWETSTVGSQRDSRLRTWSTPRRCLKNSVKPALLNQSPAVPASRTRFPHWKVRCPDRSSP